MMKIKVALTLAFLSLSLSGMAQSKQFTLEDLLSGGKHYEAMQPENLSAAWWGDELVETKKDACFLVNKNKGTKQSLFTLEDINALLSAAGLQPLKSLQSVTFPYAGKPWLLTTVKGSRVLVDWKANKIEWQQPREANVSHEDWNAASRSVAYVMKDNLYVETADGKTHAVSTDGSRQLIYGQSVHRDEFGISKGTFWSPDGSRLAFYRMDQSMVTDYPLVDISTRTASYAPLKYPMAGMTSHLVTVGIFDPATEQTVWIKAGNPKDRYFSGITWSPDGKKLYIVETNRDQNDSRITVYNTTNGEKLATIHEETHPKYVHPLHSLLFLPWDSHRLIYQSEKDGYDHLYLYTDEGKEIRCLTEGHFVVTDVLGFRPSQKSIVVVSTEQSPIQHNIYSINVETGRRTILDSGTGMHKGKLSSSGTYVLDNWSSPDVQRRIDVLTTGKHKISTLLTAKDPWKGYDVPEITSGTLKAADGTTDLYYRLIKPTHFDPTKKYPTIVYVYGGPGEKLVEASFGYSYRGWEIYMAQRGYVVFVLDNRGSYERGLDFENVTFRHLGVEEMKDQMEGVKYLKSLPFVDSNRLGVHGWSFGGFMTTNLMLTYPDVFKCGVAGGPVIDWKYYEVMYGERYMDTPQANPEGYKGSDLKEKAGSLKGRLLIIFGYNDPVCVPQHTLSFIRACEDKGTHPDLFTYPGQEHNMVGSDRIHLHEHITRYFDDFLK